MKIEVKSPLKANLFSRKMIVKVDETSSFHCSAYVTFSRTHPCMLLRAEFSLVGTTVNVDQIHAFMVFQLQAIVYDDETTYAIKMFTPPLLAMLLNTLHYSPICLIW